MRRRPRTLGELLKHWRISSGKTQDEAGAAVGVPQATWSRWENGLLSPSLGMVKRIGVLTAGILSVAEMIDASDQAPRKAG